MRKITHPLFLFFCLLSFSSCSDENGERLSEQVPIIFTASVGEAVEAPVSRASGGTWTAGDKVGIHKTVNGELGDEGFVRYVMQSDLQTLSAENEEEAWYFPSDGSDVKFIAFYPYNGDTVIETDNTTTYDLTNQTTQAAHEAADFMYHKNNDKSYNASVYAAKLDFDHKLSRIVVNVQLADGLTDDLTRMAMAINNVPTAVTCDLATGMPTARSTVGNIAVLKPINQTTNVTFQAILPPHAESDGFTDRWLTFTIDGKTSHTYKLEGDFASGCSYTYDFTLQTEGLILTNNQIESWGTGIVAWSGTYWMKLSQNSLSLANGLATGSFTVTTNHPNVPVVISNSSWLTVSRGAATTLSDVTSYVITCTVASTSTSSRTATVTVMAGTMTLTCSVSQTYQTTLDGEIVEPANCIVLKTSGKAALIPLAFLNKVGDYPGVSGYTKPFSSESSFSTIYARAVWIDVPNFATTSRKASSGTGIISAISIIGSSGPLSDTYLRVAPGEYEGNAVIAVTNSSGTILWSFHIWVLGPNDRSDMWIRGSSENSLLRNRKPAPTCYYKRYAFLPLNLGAFNSAPTTTTWSAAAGWSGHPFVGMFYQWGRKDPMPNRAQPSYVGSATGFSNYVSVSQLTAVASSSYIGLNSIKYPYYFSFSADTSIGWQGTIHTTGRTNNSWGYSSTYGYNEKSPFDPCPAGWRVPPGFNPGTGVDVICAWSWADNSDYHGWYSTVNGIYSWTMSIYGGKYPTSGKRKGITEFTSTSVTGSPRWATYWSAGPVHSTSYTTNAYALALDPYSTITNTSQGGTIADPRWNGCAIRCVTE